MTLEHYPGMTEKKLKECLTHAVERWEIEEPLVVHRSGRVQKGDDIVLVAVSAGHRKEAFDACEYIIDYLKTQAPFWKKEITSSGSHWVEARQDDDVAFERWKDDK